MNPLAFLKLIWAWKWPILVLVAFLSGMWTENSRQDSKNNKAVAALLAEERIENARANFRSLERSTKLESSVSSSNERIDGIKQKIKPQIIYVDKYQACEPGDSVPYLDVSTVRLLNSARTEVPAPEPAASGNEEGRIPSGTSVKTLVDNDLEVVKKYHELKKRHDELVDYVNEEMKKRAGK